MNLQRDGLDSWLDDALADYKAPPPRPGLELRTLAYVRAAQSARRFAVWRRWALAATAIIAIGVGAHSYWPSPAVQPVAKKAPLPIMAPAPATVYAPAKQQVVTAQRTVLATHLRFTKASLPIAASTREPKLQTFPSPLPLTPEEHALLGLVRQSPNALTEVARAQTLEPIVIPEIKIPALEPNDQDPPGEKK